jgi:hypothetical protein
MGTDEVSPSAGGDLILSVEPCLHTLILSSGFRIATEKIDTGGTLPASVDAD